MCGPVRDAGLAPNEADDDGGAGEDSDEGDRPPKWARTLNEARGVRQGPAYLSEAAPHIFNLNAKRIETALHMGLENNPGQLYTVSDFTRGRLSPELPTVLYRKIETGKTGFALAHFDHPLTVRRPVDLKSLSI